MKFCAKNKVNNIIAIPGAVAHVDPSRRGHTVVESAQRALALPAVGVPYLDLLVASRQTL